MKLSYLLQNLSYIKKISDTCDHDPDISALYYRSQDVTFGSLFVAIVGTKSDGHAYIQDAVQRGAKVIVVQTPVQDIPTVIQIQVKNSRQALAYLAAQFYGFPGNQVCLIGITGTNGKTTTAYFIESILKTAGHTVGTITTIEYRYLGKCFPNPLTTPESLDLQKIFYEMVQAGVTTIIMEVSSHALDLDRVYACYFDVAIFTNLTQDHLDYHQTLTHYFDCKQRLFHLPYLSPDHKPNASAVIYTDSEWGKKIVPTLTCPVITTGFQNTYDIVADQISTHLKETTAHIHIKNQTLVIHSVLVGKHNICNMMSAIGAAYALKISLDHIQTGIQKITSIPGRLERIHDELGRHVFVDYAHTPDALQNVLITLLDIQPKRLICVFGCGGDRDKSKRPKMAQIVTQFAHLSIITSDNPRTEDPFKIIEDIVAGIPHIQKSLNFENNKTYWIEPDRRQAIGLAIQKSQPGDVVLIAGKGHETYQLIQSRSIHFDDRIEAKYALQHYR